MPIQGAAADIIKIAMNRIDGELIAHRASGRPGAHGAAGPRRTAVRVAARGTRQRARESPAASCRPSSSPCRWNWTRSTAAPGARWPRRREPPTTARWPELPEVETIRRGLEPRIAGRTIETVRIHAGAERLAVTHSPRELEHELAGRRIESLGRHGKYLIAALDDDRSWVIHLRMTGVLLIGDRTAPGERFERARVELDDGCALRLNDIRKFGTWHLVEDPAEAMPRIGPDALSEAFSVRWLRDALGRRSVAVKSALLDQRVAAGVGQHLRRRGAVDRRHRPAHPGGLDRTAPRHKAARRAAGDAARGPGRWRQLVRRLSRRLRPDGRAPPARARLSTPGRALRAPALRRAGDPPDPPRRTGHALLRKLPAPLREPIGAPTHTL